MQRRKRRLIISNKLFFCLCIILVTLLIQQTQSYTLCSTVQSNCLICPIQCTKCDSNFSCSSCAQQYFLSSNQCLSCPQYCLTCTSNTSCTRCKDPYVLVNGTCSQCLVTNALSCTTTISAILCQPQYYVNQNYCSSCLLNCKTCTSSSTCTQCIDNFYLNNTVLTCNPCPTNCITCDQYNPTACTSCSKGYLLSTSTNTCTLIDCSLLTNCIYCQSTNICGQCSMFYYWDGAQCVYGGSVLCQYGSIGMLPSQCINSCSQQSYQSQTSISPFACIPYRTVKSNQIGLTQIYYNAYADQSDFLLLSGSSIGTTSSVLQPTGEYSFTLLKMNFSSLSSFYKVQIRLKHMSSPSSLNMQLSSISQSSSNTTQSQSTLLINNTNNNNISSTKYTSRVVHSNNLFITFSSQIKVIEIFLRTYNCQPSCLQCLNLQMCQLCVQPFYMLNYQCVTNCTVYYHFQPNRTCLLNCPATYYYFNNGTNSKYCLACVSPCSQCIDSIKCLSCANGYYFYNYTCKTTCPDQYYALVTNNTCDNCISPCRTCTNKTNCLSCTVGYWNGVNCTLICGNGYYGNNATRNCQLCDANCLTCANSSTSCTSCTSLLYLHNKQCITTCPTRYFPTSAPPLICVSCKSPCESCSSLSVCVTCAYNYFYNGTCIVNCPDGYFSNLINNTCTLCSSTCKTCSSLTSCSSCFNSSCLYQGQCISNCPSQAWYKVINSTTSQCTCVQCKYPCKQCTSSSSCLSCLTGYLQSTQCLTQCPTTYHKDDTLKQCTLCNITFPHCTECTDTKCTLCEASYLLYLGSCLTQCPVYYYVSNQKCTKCIAPCQQCVGFSNCTTCITGYIFYQSQCIISCPAGKYAYTTIVNGKNSSQCGTCQSPCLYCTQLSTKCTFCESSYYLYNNSCYLNCSSSLLPLSTFYNEPVTSTCTKCLFPCKTCQSQYQCTSCMIGYLNSVDKKCTECKVGTYPNNTAGVCETCPVQCVICYDDDYCTSCNDGFYLYQNQCISNLTICEINGYYGIGRVCVLCQQPCKTCSKSSTNCTSCLEGYTYFNNNCLVQCPTGYFRNSTTSQCDLCATECTSCVGSDSYCFSCSTGYKLFLSTMSCLTQCPMYTFTESSFCTACKYPCLECTSETQCVSCVTGSLVGSQCLSSCNSGYFTNSLSVCEACDASCQQCSSTSTNCTQCPVNTYLYNETCVSTCPSQYFPQSQSQKCMSCMGSCYECSSHVNCTSCSNTLYFYISQLTNEGQCVSSCPNGYYSSSISQLCVLCRSDCLTCANGSGCLLCNKGKVMYNGQCYTQCLQKMYSYQGVCESCRQPCYNCSDTTTCKSCINSTYLLVGSAQCMQGPICPVGYFLLQTGAICNSQCPSGSYHITSNRTCNSLGCGLEYFKGVDYYCYQQCPSGYIADQYYQCVSCSSYNECNDGLFFSLKYYIQYDQLIVKVVFSQLPRYNVDQQPGFVITPSTQYVVKAYSSSINGLEQEHITVVSQQKHQQNSTAIVEASSYNIGQQVIILNLNPSTSLQQTYFNIKFNNPLSTFQNPLQHSYSTIYLQGYDHYNNDQLQDLSGLGVLALLCALIGLVKNPLMTDYGQLLWILALNNVHYPLNLRTFLQGTKVANLHKFMSIPQPNMSGNGKFAYVVNQGLLQNAFGNIMIIIIGLLIAGIGLIILRFLQWYLQYGRIGGSVAPNQQHFISKNHGNNHQDNNNHQSHQNINNKNNIFQQDHSININKQHNNISSTSLQTTHQLPKPLRLKNFLQQIYTLNNFKILFINRFIYFNYLHITLFTFTQLSHLDTSEGVNVFGFALSFLTLFLVIVYPFVLLKDKPRFTFLYIRKIIVALSLILSVNYPAYCIGVLSVTNITAILLINSYRIQKWKLQMQINAIGQALQLVLMIGMAVFIMIGQGNQTTFKEYFSYFIVIVSVGILLYYILFSVFLFTLYMVKKLLGRDFITEWIEKDKREDTDGTDSETMNSSMKDHQQKKVQPIKIQQKQNAQQQDDMNWNNIQQILKHQKENNTNNGDQNFIQGQIKDFIQTRPLGVSPTKNKIQQQPNNHLFWNYQTNSQQDHNKQHDKQPPKMLIRCVNQFSDYDHKQKRENENDEKGDKNQDSQGDDQKGEKDQ